MIKGLLLESPYKEFSQFGFSGVKGQTKVGREGLFVVSSRVTIVVSSQNEQFLRFLIEQIFQREEIILSALKIVPESADRELNPGFDDHAKFVCISPILLLAPVFNSDAGKKFIMPDQDAFSDDLYDSTIKKMSESGIETSSISGIEKFQVIPDMDYIEKLQAANKKFSRIYSFYHEDVMYEARGYTFPFTLYAAREVLEFVFALGLGHYNHKGFGMVDLAVSDGKMTEQIYAASLKTA